MFLFIEVESLWLSGLVVIPLENIDECIDEADSEGNDKPALRGQGDDDHDI